MLFANKTIWVIGASSGIGKALAIELAAQGAKLILSARRVDQLNELRDMLGQEHEVYPLDVSDQNQVYEVANTLTEKERLDSVLFMAAVYEPSDIKDIDINFTRRLVDINMMGAFYVTHAILPIFERQQSGQIVFCASVAGYTGLPSGQPYSAMKAAMINFAESLHAEADDYLDVKIINPGFVRTPATDKNTFEMPMRIEADEAARAICRGLKKNAFEIHFPKRFTYLMKLLAAMPYWIKLRLTRQF